MSRPGIPADHATRTMQRARTEYIRHRESWGDATLQRTNFNRLAKAAAEMIAAVDLPPEYLTRLQAHMRVQGVTDDIGHLNVALMAMLEHYRAAAQLEGGTGEEAYQPARIWAWIAADAWRAEFGDRSKPSASDAAPFWRAIQALQDAHDDVPRHSQDTLKAALAIWRDARGVRVTR